VRLLLLLRRSNSQETLKQQQLLTQPPAHLHTGTLLSQYNNTTAAAKELNDFSLFLLLLPVFPTSFPTTFVYLFNLLGKLLPNVENEHLKTFRWLNARWRMLLPVWVF